MGRRQNPLSDEWMTRKEVRDSRENLRFADRVNFFHING
jgi:hypothetical protein